MQPWSAQLSEKRSDVELLQSERDLLLSKREEEKRALGDLEQLLSSLRSERQEKVRDPQRVSSAFSQPHLRWYSSRLSTVSQERRSNSLTTKERRLRFSK